ncbi:hypothetical protein DEO72_LG9g538 [Vigna unguiculata]|uniref:Uncharacterized protein n=1 Tax=Vigna unguiculata TaxID=3917 RepID=A0A4D6N0A1_VIGUN|nr:hypothetical protein DEO72_LG9g538 [Vigna unguiculata]
MATTLIPFLLLIVLSNIVIANATFESNEANNVVIDSAQQRLISNIKNKRFHVLPKGPVPPSGPSHGCTPPCLPSNVVNNIKSKGFHVLPKGPPHHSGPSSPCAHPPCGGIVAHKNVVSDIKSQQFHVLPKGPIPPSGPSPPCTHPPCGNRVN